MFTRIATTERAAEVLQLMKEGDDAFNARDVDGMKAAHHPDMIAHVTGSLEPIVGREAHAAAMAGFFQAFPDVRVHNDPYETQLAAGDWMTVITRITGTFTGEMALPGGGTIPGTGKSFDLAFATTARWDGDLLAEEWVFWDSALMAEQIGLA